MRDRKGVDSYVKGRGKKLKRKGSVIKMYYLRKMSIFNERK